VFDDIFPIGRLYGDYYTNPSGHGIIGEISTLESIHNEDSIRHGDERVFIGEVIYKNARDANEEVNVKKRGGEILKGNTNFADMRIRDDTGQLGARIGRFDWEGTKSGGPGGRFFLDHVPVGSHLLIRAKFFNNLKFGFVQKYKVLK
jgi:hypothetical protein